MANVSPLRLRSYANRAEMYMRFARIVFRPSREPGAYSQRGTKAQPSYQGRNHAKLFQPRELAIGSIDPVDQAQDP